jgi:hypothetical protein
MNMKKKIVGILVMTLLVTMAIPSIGTMSVEKSKPLEKNIIKENEGSNNHIPFAHNTQRLKFVGLDSDWDYDPKTGSGLLYPYVNNMIIVFGSDPPGMSTSAPEPRIQAESAGGARILGAQGNTPDKPAIGFFAYNGVDDGGGGNGIYRPAANTMAFATGSNERMRITSAGRVGIDRTNPTSKLHVDGPVATAITTIVAPPLPGYYITAEDSVIFAEATGPTTPGFVILPQAVLSPGREYKIKNIGTAGIVWVVANLTVGDEIDYAPEYGLGPLDSIIVACNGVDQWFIIAEYDS